LFEITFSVANDLPALQADGAPFNVYVPGKYSFTENNQKIVEDVKASSFAVRSGEELQANWPLENFENEIYHLRVYGPNGFYREYAGDKNDPSLSVSFAYEKKNSPQNFSGNVILILKNTGKENLPIEIIDNSYKNPRQSFELAASDKKEIVLNLAKSYNWYDTSIKIKGKDIFEKRFAGRVEAGAPGKSDPFMGSV
jgi:phospholipase C